jgi:hypothetical protein
LFRGSHYSELTLEVLDACRQLVQVYAVALRLSDRCSMIMQGACSCTLGFKLTLEADELSLYACLQVLKLKGDSGDCLVAAGAGLSAAEHDLHVLQLFLDVGEAIRHMPFEGDLHSIELDEVRVEMRGELIALGLQLLDLQIKCVEARLESLLCDEVLDVAEDTNVIESCCRSSDDRLGSREAQ